MSDKFLFPSEEWVNAYWELLKNNAAYKDAAATWEGDFIFRVIYADGTDEKLYLDLWHGECREAREAGPDDDAEYVWEGTFENWKRLLAGEFDPIKALMSRKFKLPKGDMGKVMRATKAASELVATAQRVPTRFPDK